MALYGAVSNRLVGPVSWQPEETNKHKKASYESRNNLNYPFGAGANWRFADVGV
jgi:hypothetical protein